MHTNVMRCQRWQICHSAPLWHRVSRNKVVVKINLGSKELSKCFLEFLWVFFSDLNLVIHVYRLYSYLWSFWLQDLSSMRLCIWNAFQNGQLNYHKVTYIWPWKFMNLLWILIIFLTWIFKPTNFPDTEIKVMYTLQRRKKDMPLPFSSLNPHPHPFCSVLWIP